VNYKDFPLEQTIPVDFWLSLCDFEWQEGQPVRPGLVFVDTTRLLKFFEAVRGKGPVILVTAACDYSVVTQSERHPNFDIPKLMQWVLESGRMAYPTDGYVQSAFAAPCNFKDCKATDRYSIKIDRHTLGTFNEVPPEVAHWFSSNLDAEIPRSEWLPFGLAPSHDPCQTRNYFAEYRNWEKFDEVYCNFSPNTVERARLLEVYRRDNQFCVRGGPHMSAEAYVEELSGCGACLSPEGNGVECYRTMEGLYVGSVPVVKKSRLTGFMRAAGLPVFEAEDLFNINTPALFEYTNSEPFADADLSVLSKDYWRDRFQKVRAEVGV
jgi:hypothetical protein